MNASSGTNAARHGAVALNENEAADSGLLSLALAALDDSKATDIIPIDLRGKTPLADHMVIASGTSTRHVATIAERVIESLKHDGKVVPRLEGVDQGDWALIDAGDVIVHIFRPEVREFYNLEGMWMSDDEARARPAPLDS